MKGTELKRLIELYEQGQISWREWLEAVKTDNAIHEWNNKGRGAIKMKILERISDAEEEFLALFAAAGITFGKHESTVKAGEVVYQSARFRRWLAPVVLGVISIVMVLSVWYWMSNNHTTTLPMPKSPSIIIEDFKSK